MLAVYNKVADYIVILNFDGKISFCNESFLKKLEYTEEEVVKLNISTIMNQEKNIKNLIKECWKEKKILEFYTKSNKKIIINANISVEDFDNKKSIFIIGKDLKEELYKNYNNLFFENIIELENYIDINKILKNVELTRNICLESKKSMCTEKELKRYLNVSADLLGIIDKDNYIKRVSPNWLNFLGWAEDELISMVLTDIIHPNDLKIWNEKIIFKNKITRNVIRLRNKKGKYISFEWSSEYIDDEEIYVITARDITNKLEIEKENRKLEEKVKLQIAKNEIFSTISHEFRTPINILLGTIQVLNKNIENNNIEVESLKKYSDYIKQNSYRLLRLVNNLIDMNKMDMGAYRLRCCNQDIISIIEDITQSVVIYTKNNKINLVFDTDQEEVITYCDADKIERIMLNILSNAVKYTPENGFIKVTVTSTEKDVIVSVKDNGEGIPSEKLNIIFDRFGQANVSLNRKFEGSGIGLSIVKNLIEMHGGKINVISKVNEGTEFIFNIPIKINKEQTHIVYDIDRKSKHIERCDIEFSDIYSI